MATFFKAIGSKIKKMDKEYFFIIHMVKNMKEILLKDLSKGKEYIFTVKKFYIRLRR